MTRPRWTEFFLIQRLEQAIVDKVPIEKEKTTEVENVIFSRKVLTGKSSSPKIKLSKILLMGLIYVYQQ